MSDFFKALENKIESDLPLGFDQSFWAKIEEAKRPVENPILAFLKNRAKPLGLGLAFAASIVIVINLYDQNQWQNKTEMSAVIESSEMLENLELMTEIDDVENLSDEEWAILLEERPDAKSET